MKQINFLPDEVFRTQNNQRLMIKCGVLVLGGLLLIGGWYFYTRGEISAIALELKAVEQKQNAARSQAEHTLANAAKAQTISKNMAMYQKLKSPIPTTSVLAQISRLMPPALGLTSLSLVGEPINPAPKRPKKSGRSKKKSSDKKVEPLRLTLEGLAPNDFMIARFIGYLDDLALFSNVEMTYSRPVNRGSLLGREFRVTAEIPLNRTFVLSSARNERYED